MIYPISIANLIDSFKKLPGIGEKTAERMAFSVLTFEDDDALNFSQAILDTNKKIRKCNICNHITEKEICDICSDTSRDEGLICVVEDSKSVFMMEKMGTYSGKYFVLESLISPLSRKGLDNSNIDKLIELIKTKKISELIIVLKPSIEGETTALYISKFLENVNVKITKIAQGVPVGADMEYVDVLTLEKAFEQRREI